MFGMGRELHEYSDEEQELGKVYDRVLMKRLIQYLKPYRFQLLVIAIFMIGTTLSRLAGPVIIQMAIDRHIIPGELDGLSLFAGLFVLSLLGEFIFAYFEEYRQLMVGQHVMRDLRQTLFSHLQRLDVQYFDKNPVGRLMTRVMGDVQVLNLYSLIRFGIQVRDYWCINDVNCHLSGSIKTIWFLKTRQVLVISKTEYEQHNC